MYKTIKVLLIIAVAGTLLQISAYIADLLRDVPENGYHGYGVRATDTLRRLLVYWFSGAFWTVVAAVLWSRQKILSMALGAGGIYLLILGANGGLWTNQMVWYRLLLAFVNLGLFLVILKRIDAEAENSQ
jgi:hypothetical protein